MNTNEAPVQSGCFSWWKRWKKGKTKKSSESNGTPTATSSEQKQAEGANAALPSKKDYAIEATKQTIDLLGGVAGLVGIPLVKEILDIGLAIVTTCDTINDVQDKVAELKNRITSFLLVIAKIARDPEELKATPGLVEELEDLKDCLKTITTRLDAIRDQNIVLTTLLPGANLRTIEECVNCFQDGIDRFQTLRGIHAAQDLTQLQSRLEELYGLQTVVAEKVDRIQVDVSEVKSSVDELRLMLGRNGETDLFSVSTKIPPLPDIFIGRDPVVNRIAEALASGDVKQSRVSILGPGGMGKTSTALAVINHLAIMARFLPQNCVWVPCISLPSPNALLAYLARRFGVSGQPDALQAIITTLEQESDPFIILFDNFETSWHPTEGDQVAVRNILRTLDALPNISILVTMRSQFPPLPHWQTEHLAVLNLEDCRHIYMTIEQRLGSNDDLDPLLEAVGCLPYAVTLVATQAKYADASPSQMLAEWNAIGSQMLTEVDDNMKGMDSSIELSVNSAYVTKSTGAPELLQVLSMLPAGIYQDDISIWITNWRLSALSTLRNAALVVSRRVLVEGAERTHLSVLPVVQSYMRQGNRIPESVLQSTYEACISFLHERKSMIDGPNHPRYKVDLPEIESQESNLEAILRENIQQLLKANATNTPSPEQLDAFLTFVFYQRWTRPRLDMAEQVLAVTQQVDSPLHEAEATYCLAQQQYSLWLAPQATSGFEKARDLYLSLDLPVKACDADAWIVFCRREAEGHKGGGESLTAITGAMRSRWEPFFPTHHAIYGLVLSWTAFLSWLVLPLDSPQYPSILQDFLSARDIFTELKRPYDLRDCMVNLLRYYMKISQYEEARVLVDQALKLTKEEHLPEDSFLYLSKARCMKATDDWGDELHSITREGLRIAQKIGYPFEIGLALEELVEMYLRDNDWSAARLAYEEILKECGRGSGKSINDMAGRARDNLAYVNTKESDPHNASITYRCPLRH